MKDRSYFEKRSRKNIEENKKQQSIRTKSSSKTRIIAYLLKLFSQLQPITRLRIGAILGWLTMRLARSRVHIARKNLALCFPSKYPRQREKLLKEHFRALAQSVVDRGVLWYGTPDEIRTLATLSGFDKMDALLTQGRPIIGFAPHFVSVDVIGTRLMLELSSAAAMYSSQSNLDVDAVVRAGRTRFNKVFLVNRRDGPRELIRHLRAARPIFYLPDLDFGPKSSIFVPFFGIQAATIPTTAQLARRWNAVVLPLLAFWDSDTGVYRVEILPALPNFPGSDSLEVATERLNHEIELWIRQCPSQYYWVHRRFKTRPQGQEKYY